MKNVIDSSAWIEYFTDSTGAEHFSAAINDLPNLIVPAITIVEVFRFTLRVASERQALQVAALMRQGTVVPLTGDLALAAASLGHKHKLPLADSIIYATAQQYKATVWTQDADFADLLGVQYFSKAEQRYPR